MSSWAERVHRRAADFSNVVTSCGHPGSSAPTYPYRLEKVKFGVPLEEVCKNDNIPGPLLVLILKLNKESPNRRDVFRAPGHQGAMKKLIHFLQAGRLVNVDNYSVYTIASVLKKFLRKVPNGIFGRSGEEELFAIIELTNESEQTDRLHKLLQSLPKYTQHLLVLLFGTFRVIASNAAHAGTGMTSEALGVSVAPSFFQSCVSDGKTARMEDVLKFKVATKIMKHIVDKFATHDLFGRENYEYYARVTGRILKVQDEWICSFQYPPPPRGKLAQQKYALQHSLEAEKTWLQCQCERWGLLAQEESRSTPALLTSSSSALDNSVVSLGVTPEHSFMESCARLSVSLEGPGLFALTSSPLPTRKHDLPADDDDDDIDEDDFNNDDDDYDDEDADDDEDENDHNHYNDHLQHRRHGENEEFANELEISNGGADGGGDNNENIENNSYKANFRTCLSASSSSGLKARKLKCRSSLSSTDRQGDGGSGAASGDNTFTDSQDDVDDEMTSVVKRRYKQNKKKSTKTNSAQIRVQQQQQRRFRTSTSGNTKSLESQNSDFFSNDYEYIAKPNTSTISSITLKALTDPSTTTSIVQHKSRVCSRCKRGIRHSSSCSSSTASGGGGGGGGVANAANGNGMTMDELRAVNRYAESTKSLSYLPQVHERQTARMRTRSEWFLGPKDGDLLCVPPNTCSNCCLSAVNLQTTGNYLGGGSTRDMRRMLQSANEGPMASVQHVNEAVNTSLYLYYKQQRQQQQYMRQQQPPSTQRQSFHLLTEHMDTDESYSSYIGGSSSVTDQQTTTTNLHSMQQQVLATHQQHQQLNPRSAQQGQGLLLDTNYGRYDFDDKDILITTTSTTTKTTDNNNFTYNNNNNNMNNKHKHNKENNSSYGLSNRQTTCNETTLPHQQQLQHQTQPLSSSFYHMHALAPQHQCHNISHYFSTDSLLTSHQATDASTVVPTKLSYHSPRQQHREEQHLQHYQYNSDEVSSLNSTNANIITTTKTNTTSPTNTNDQCIPHDTEEEVDYIVTSHYRHSTPMLQRRRLRQQALRRQRLPSTSSSLYQSFNASLQAPMASAGGGRFNPNNRHSSINSDSHVEETHLTASSSGGGGGNNNFVSIIFNVLDFLF